MIIFPEYKTPISVNQNTVETEYTDYAFDFESGNLKLRGGRDFLCEGKQALALFIWKVLNTRRGVYDAYPSDFGFAPPECTTFDEDFTDMLRERITEALIINPNIISLSNFIFDYTDAVVNVEFTVNTNFGAFDFQHSIDF